MPVYTYKCNECNYQFEQRQRMTDDPLTDCPVCGGSIRRLVNSVGVLFKGSGFYITDSRNGKAASSTAKEEKPAAGKEKKTTTKETAATPATTTAAE